MSNYYSQQTQYHDYNDYHYNNQYQSPQHDVYAMNDMNSSYAPQHNNHDDYYQKQETAYLSQEKPYNSESFSRAREHRSCCDILCCGCCTCCPRWCRWITCILFLIIICLGIAIGVLAALFKMPSIDFNGINGSPSFSMSGTQVVIGFNLGFGVNNPNVESVTFKSIDAKVYYDGYNTSIGTGQANNVHINSNAITNITYPLNVTMDVSQQQYLTIFQAIFTQCQTSGAQLKLNYDITATANIIGIGIPIPYSNSVTVTCPSELTQASGILGSLSSILGSSNSDIASIANGLGSAAASAAGAASSSSVDIAAIASQVTGALGALPT